MALRWEIVPKLLHERGHGEFWSLVYGRRPGRQHLGGHPKYGFVPLRWKIIYVLFGIVGDTAVAPGSLENARPGRFSGPRRGRRGASRISAGRIPDSGIWPVFRGIWC